MNISREKITHICVKIDLSEPFTTRFWVDDGETQAMVVVLYERLSSFFYRCEWVGNILNNHTFDSKNQTNSKLATA